MDRWHNKTVLLEFEHGPVGNDGSRCTEVRLVEFMSPASSWPPSGKPWKQSAGRLETDHLERVVTLLAKGSVLQGNRAPGGSRAARTDRHGVGWKPPKHEPLGLPIVPNPLVAAAIYQYYTRHRRK